MLNERPTLRDVIDTQKRIMPHIFRTPLRRYGTLSALLGAEIYVKHENHQVLCSFKVRGAVNVISRLSQQRLDRGIIAASTGNFGQGIAYAASVFGADSHIVVPTDVNTGKRESMESLGSNIILHGIDFDEAKEHAESLSKEKNYTYIHSANEPGLTAGTGTYTLEIIEDLPDVNAIIVPVGGGSGACGAAIVAKSIDPRIKVIGVQSEAAPGAFHSWRDGKIMEAPNKTVAEGLATGGGYEFTQDILRDLLDDFILVSEDELREAVVLHLEKTHNLVEHAGAAPLAAALKIKEKLSNMKVALVATGGNISLQQIEDAMKYYSNSDIDPN